MSKNNKTLQWSHVSPYCLIRNLVRHCWMIVAAALVMSMSVTLLINWFHVPKYRASMTYAVNSRTTSYTSSGNLTSTREVAAVLTDFLGTDVMRDGLKEADPRLANFDGTITATQMGESNFIEVSCTASTPEQAFLALKAVTNVFPKMAGFISSRSVLNVLRNPTVSSYPSNIIDVNRFSKLAGILGAVGMVALLCYFSIQSETIQTRTGARQLLDAPVIASVSHERKNRTIKSMLQQSNRQVQVFSPSTSFS
jgi:capsular polysaccharide biosynthesis protein